METINIAQRQQQPGQFIMADNQPVAPQPQQHQTQFVKSTNITTNLTAMTNVFTSKKN